MAFEFLDDAAITIRAIECHNKNSPGFQCAPKTIDQRSDPAAWKIIERFAEEDDVMRLCRNVAKNVTLLIGIFAPATTGYRADARTLDCHLRHIDAGVNRITFSRQFAAGIAVTTSQIEDAATDGVRREDRIDRVAAGIFAVIQATGRVFLIPQRFL